MDIVVGIVRHQNKFALLQTKDGEWVFPGGKMQTGDSFDEAVENLFEEIGLRVVPAANLDTDMRDGTRSFYKICQYLGGDLNLKDQDDFIAAQWLTADQVLNLTGGHHFAPLHRYLQEASGRIPQFTL